MRRILKLQSYQKARRACALSSDQNSDHRVNNGSSNFEFFKKEKGKKERKRLVCVSILSCLTGHFFLNLTALHEFYVFRKRRSTDFENLKSWKVWSGDKSTLLWRPLFGSQEVLQFFLSFSVFLPFRFGASELKAEINVWPLLLWQLKYFFFGILCPRIRAFYVEPQQCWILYDIVIVPYVSLQV